MPNKVRFGLTLSNRGVILGLTTPDELLEMAQIADQSGVFSHVWVGDTIMANPRLESITLMAAIAALTKNVRIGPSCMASFPSRNPIVFAYQWASLDYLSKGRMILATCMGGSITPGAKNAEGFRAEYLNMGITAADRAQRQEENITIVRKLWKEESVTYEGKFHKLEGAYILPKPIQNPPPIWIASTPDLQNSKPHLIERSLRRVARMGDGWLTTAHPASKFADLRNRIFTYAQEYDRSFEDLPCCAYHNININDDYEKAFQESKTYLDKYYNVSYTREGVETWVALGSPSQCVEHLQTMIDAGATDIQLRFPSWDQKTQLKRCIEEVFPNFL